MSSRPNSRATSPTRAGSPILSTAKAHEEFDMMGYALPPGTIVSTQAWSMHRDEEVFPSAETFLPERWLMDPTADKECEEERLSRYVGNLADACGMYADGSTVGCTSTSFPSVWVPASAAARTSRIS